MRLVSAPVQASAIRSIVTTATDILREELQSLPASGIGQIPSGIPTDLSIPGQSGGVQPLVDALAGLLKVPPGQLTQVMAPTAAAPSAEGEGSQSIRVLVSTRPVAAGDVTQLLLRLENDDDQPDECGFSVTDLVGPSGNRLPASHVRVSPSPVRIPARGSADIRIEVRIPSGTAAGSYTGLLQTDDGESLRALVQIRVGH